MNKSIAQISFLTFVFLFLFGNKMANADDVIIKCRLDSVINYETKIYYTYHPNGQLHTKTSSEGTWEYDDRGRKVRFAQEDGSTIHYMEWYYHNESDALIDNYSEHRYGARQYWHTFSYKYDNNNRIINVSESYYDEFSPMEYTKEETYNYDSNGNLIRLESYLYNMTSFFQERTITCYDNGHVLSVEEFHATYDPASTSYVSHQKTEYVYDANWLLVLEKLYNISENNDAILEKEIKYIYDSEGRCISKTNLVSFDGVMTESTKVDSIYNDNSIIAKNYEMSFGDWKELSANEKIFDSNGRTICENNYTNKNGDMIKNSYKIWTYDLNGKMLSRKSYVLEGSDYKLTSSESWTYDTAGNLTNHTNPDGKSESWTYDTAGNLTNHIYPSGLSESWSYDAAGNLISHNSGGSRYEYKYDSFQNMIQSEYYTRRTSDDAWEMAQRVKYYYDTSVNESEISMGDNADMAIGKHISKLLYYVTYTKIGSYKTTYYYSQPEIELVDGIEYYKDMPKENVKSISYTRTFNNIKWQSLYIPFSMSYDDWKDDFEVAYINSIHQYDKDDDGIIDETSMEVVKIKNGSLIPNTPYLIRAKTTGEKTITVTNSTLCKSEENSIECSTMLAKYTFTGTYNPIPASTLIENNYYAMGGGSLIMTDGSNGLKPFRWYMKIDARSPMYNVSNMAKAITINVVGEEETTGITNTQHLSTNTPIYDLNGRRVNQNNLKPGIYVKNGKKIIIK